MSNTPIINSALSFIQRVQAASATSRGQNQSPTDAMVANLRCFLLSNEAPELNFHELRDGLRQESPKSLERLEGLIDDLAAERLGSTNAGLAVALRRGDIAALISSEPLPSPGSDGYSRIMRALLEAPSPEAYSALKERGLQLDTKEIAKIINRSKIPLGRFTELGLGPRELESLLSEIAPQLSFADLRELDGQMQADVLNKCQPRFLNYLFINNSTVEALPAGMDQLKSLNCSSCHLLSTLPAGMSQLKSLNCHWCTQLGVLPADMSQLKSLGCSHCYQLGALPTGMSQLESLNCSDCHLLSTLPADMGQLESLDCSNCDQLSVLPADMDQLKSLDCSWCRQLGALPTGMSQLQNLNCSWCDQFVALPADMDKLKSLICSWCSQLRALPADLGQLRGLDCSSCDQLSVLPAGMNQLKGLNCSWCSQLRRLPLSLPHCTYLNFSGCPLLVSSPTPELPANADVYRAGEGAAGGSGFWTVAIHQVQQRPKTFLNDLGSEWLLKARPFPSVQYLEEDGTPSTAIDIGGVRRDLITRILDSLFQKQDEVKKVDPHEQLSLTDVGMPICNPEDESEINAFKSLARVMALCYQDVCHLKTGPLFSPRLYKAILAESPEEKAIAVAGLQEGLLELLHADFPEIISEDVWKQVSFLLKETGGQDFDASNSKELIDYLKSNGEAREALSSAILKWTGASSFTPLWTAISQIEAEMKKALGEEAWAQVRVKGPKDLQDHVEGILSKEALWNHMDWEWDSDSTSDDAANHIKTFVKDWIDRASDKDLESFVRVVTGNKRLSPKRLKMELYDRGAEYIPVVHTCFFSMELSNGYTSQESFDKYLNLCLEHASAGSGFQFG